MKVLFEMDDAELEVFEAEAKKHGYEGVGALMQDFVTEIGRELGITGTAELRLTTATRDDDLDWLFKETDRLQSEFEKLRSVAQPSMDCDECGGGGRIEGGSLGSCCPSCDGSGVVDAPFSEPLALPDMAQFRGVLQAAENTKRLGGTVDLAALYAQLGVFKTAGEEQAKQLRGAEAETKRLRGAPRKTRRRHLLSGATAPSTIASARVYEEGSDEED